MEDRMQIGSLIPLKDGWFYDVDLDVKFHINESGERITEEGERLLEDPFDDDEARKDDA